MRNPGKPDWSDLPHQATAAEPAHHVEQRKVLALGDKLLELNPLILSRVDTGRVLRASVEKDL
jgi:hypothetical protein